VSGPPIAVVRVRGTELCEAVLVRVLGAVAALADLPVDRLSDAQIMAGVIADRAPGLSVDGGVTVRFWFSPAVIRMALGPLQPGGAARLIEETAVPGVGPVLERMADEVHMEQGDDGDLLAMVIGRSAEVTA
jgi:hypothetical protein